MVRITQTSIFCYTRWPSARCSRSSPARLSRQAEALQRNPGGRLTTPEDVARVLVALADPAVTWINGAAIPADGGEIIVG